MFFGAFDTFGMLGVTTPVVPTLGGGGGGGGGANHILTEGSDFIDTEASDRLITET